MADLIHLAERRDDKGSGPLWPGLATMWPFYACRTIGMSIDGLLWARTALLNGSRMLMFVARCETLTRTCDEGMVIAGTGRWDTAKR